ncbi:MAG: WGR domain-containing protein [Myxococcota bacterium]
MPRYEFVEGSSSKFWEIERDGNTFTVRYGKIGTDGQTSTKSFDSPEKTQKEYDKMIASKTKKGYQLVESVERAPEAGSNPALEQAILDDPAFSEGGSKDRWLVYADWLQSQDDPRGALISAQAGGGDADGILEANKKAFLGRFAGDMEPFVEIGWHMGFWRSVKAGCDYDTADDMGDAVKGIASVVGHVLRHPSAKFLSELRIGLVEGVTDGEADWSDTVDAVVKNGIRPSLRKLVVGEFEMGDDTEVSWTSIGSLGGIWPVLPRLEHLEVQGGSIGLGKIDAPHLKHLELRTGGLPKEPVQAVAKAKLPELEHLELWFGADEYGAECTAAEIQALLKSKNLPKLRWLGLKNSEIANEIPRSWPRARC